MHLEVETKLKYDTKRKRMRKDDKVKKDGGG